MRQLKIDQLSIRIYENRAMMGSDAALMVTEQIKQLLNTKEFINIIFAAAPSQNELLENLYHQPDIDWLRVNAFHMDEYIGLGIHDQQSFGFFLNDRLFKKVSFHAIHYLDGKASDPVMECMRYSDLLRKYPTDIVCMGIGENNHIAFNDPHVADFSDAQWVKIVDLDEASRQQQVNDGCFSHIDTVPRQALTLTIPALMNSNYIFCVVPGERKAKAVQHTLYEAVTEKYPSTILRKHEHAILYLDNKSSMLL